MIEEKNQQDQREEILEEYLKPKYRQSKFWLWVILGIVIVVLGFIYKVTVIDATIDPKVLVSSVELFDVKSQWVENEKIDTPEFKGIVLVPQLTFRIRNIGNINLKNIYFLGVFRFVDSPKAIGEGFCMTLKDALKPHQESEKIELRSKFGYQATTKQAFYKNSKDWKNSVVEIFARSGSADMIYLKKFYISRKIEGLDIDVIFAPVPNATELPVKNQ